MRLLLPIIMLLVSMATLSAAVIPDLPQVTYTCTDGEVHFAFDPQQITPPMTDADLYVAEIFRKETKGWGVKTSKNPGFSFTRLDGVRYREPTAYRFALIRNGISKMYFSTQAIVNNTMINPISAIIATPKAAGVTISFIDPSNVEHAFPYQIINTRTKQVVLTGEFPGMYGVGRSSLYDILLPAGAYKITMRAAAPDHFGVLFTSSTIAATFTIAPAANN